jgi:hypothetical protein
MPNSLGSSISFYITVAEMWFFDALDALAQKYQLDRSSAIRLVLKRAFQEEGWLDDDLLPIPRVFKKKGFRLPDPLPTRNQPGLKRYIDTCEFICKGRAYYKECDTDEEIEDYIRKLMSAKHTDVLQLCIIDENGDRGPDFRYSRSKNGTLHEMPIDDDPV